MYLTTYSICHVRSFCFQSGFVTYDLISIYHVYLEARKSGNRLDAVEEQLNTSSEEDSGFLAGYLKRIKRWLFLHSQHLNFITILVLASVSSVLHRSIFLKKKLLYQLSA